ncbi:MAG: hypothetical protein IKD71_02940 [Solobacterium sp.]|nr:hypothetical protein [Solobacterium sp.]
MVRSITGELEASYYAEQENKDYTLHLNADVHMTKEVRDELLAVSASGENAAAKGFMGKLRDMIGTALLPEDDQPSLLSLGVMSMGSPTGLRTGTGSYDWSLKKFKAEAGETEKARDDLERSIVANIADDIIVSIEGSRVDLTILKTY